MKQIFIIILMFSFVLPVLAEISPRLSALITSANEHYKKGQYEKAIETYEQILEKGYEAPELYYNLANTYYKSNKITYSILNYERAKLLSPNDPDINYNLELARIHVVDKIEVLPQMLTTIWLNQLINLMPSDKWAIFSIATFIVFLLLFSLFLFLNNITIKKISFYTGILLLFISIATFLCSYQQNEKITNRNSAIVFSPAVTVKSSPDDSGTDLFILHEGTKITVIDSLGSWQEIKLSDGNIGWLQASDIVLI